METAPIIPYRRKVYYYETDRMGIVHHSNYIRWMEEARLDYLRQIGLPYDEMEARGIMMPVLGVQAEYKKAFRFGDAFLIRLKLADFRGIKFTIAYDIYKEGREDEGPYAGGSSRHGFVDDKLAPFHLKRECPDIYGTLMGRLE